MARLSSTTTTGYQSPRRGNMWVKPLHKTEPLIVKTGANYLNSHTWYVIVDASAHLSHSRRIGTAAIRHGASSYRSGLQHVPRPESGARRRARCHPGAGDARPHDGDRLGDPR